MTTTPLLSVDVMGGDRGPKRLLDGLARAAREDGNLRFLIHGDRAALEPLIRGRRALLADRAEIRHAEDVVRMDDEPAWAMRHRRKSSMWQALDAVARGEAQVALSTGNTGALLAMSVLRLRKAPGVDRPAIAVHWPAERPEGYTTVLDVGADVRAQTHNLAQYAVMGAEYARLSFGTKRPRVGLLNLGTEKSKGPPHLREAWEALDALARRPGASFDFHGFVEGSSIPTDTVDVVVTDGFTGNIALKTAEGTARFIRDSLKAAFRYGILSRIALLAASGSLMRLRRKIDPRRVNGGVFLGLDGSVVKAHGDSDAVGFASAVALAAKMAATDFPTQVASQLAKLRLDGNSGASHADDGGPGDDERDAGEGDRVRSLPAGPDPDE